MTEAEWNACTEPGFMLEFLRASASNRKGWLLGCAICRRIWHLLSKLGKQGIEAVERHVDGISTKADRAIASKADRALNTLNPDPGIALCAFALLNEQASGLGNAGYAANAATQGISNTKRSIDKVSTERVYQCYLIRDIFGNPYRPVALDSAWLSWNDGTIGKLAQTIYDDRRFQNLPVLADALEEAGCANDEILSHCRSGQEHVRGCWVVDLLLGKE